MTPQQAYDNLIAEMKKISTLSSAAGLLHWDQETYMPDGGVGHRANQLSLLSGMTHEMFTAPQVGEWLSIVEGSDLVKDPLSDAAVNVRELRHEYDREVKVPKELVEALSRETSLAHQVWRDARADSDFSKFAPSLTRIVELNRQMADAIGTGATRYDTLMDAYEPGMTSAEMKGVFDGLSGELSQLIGEVIESGKTPDRTIFDRSYPEDRQKLFASVLSSLIGFDLKNGNIHTTTHPFCSGFGPGDTRVNIRYNPKDLTDSVFSVLHEDGHGIYDQGLPEEHWGTPRGESVSLGIHESQSRMWENLVGRSLAFWEHVYPMAQGFFPESLNDTPLEAFYFAINDVKPSFIRVEADQATYNLHILLRFEIEQAIISGDLAVADIPGAWNDRFKELLHIEVTDDANGCLQDVHWSGGMFGYFPTYTLGNLYSAQFFAAATEELGDLNEQFRRGDFAQLKTWLNEKIHAPGMTYRASDLVKVVTGKPLSHEPLMAYLRSVLSPLFGI